MSPDAFTLSLEQKFQLHLMDQVADNLSRQQAIDMLKEATRLIAAKDAVIRDLVNQLHEGGRI